MKTLSPRLADRLSTGTVWVRVGTLWDGGRAVAGAHLVYDARSIRHAGAEPPPGLDGAPVDLAGWTAMPALVESHAHLFLEGAPVRPQEREASLRRGDFLERARARLERVGSFGIAAVRDAGDRHGVGLALQREGGTPGVVSPGAALHRRGRYGAFLGEPLESFETPEAAVEARARQGARWLKLLVSGVIDFKKAAVTAPPQVLPEEASALVRAAAARGLPTMAHASGAESIEIAVAAGVRTLEHGFFVTRDQLARMRDRAVAWVPTFAPVRAQVDRADELGWDAAVVDGLRRILDAHAERLRHAAEIGVTILAGSDAGSGGVPHGAGLLHELALLEEAGLSPARVLAAATGGAALAAGRPARILFAAASPLETVRNLKGRRVAVLDGRAWEGEGVPTDGL
jgi:imidazolonepropionase-like amidohydrolase